MVSLTSSVSFPSSTSASSWIPDLFFPAKIRERPSSCAVVLILEYPSRDSTISESVRPLTSIALTMLASSGSLISSCRISTVPRIPCKAKDEKPGQPYSSGLKVDLLNIRERNSWLILEMKSDLALLAISTSNRPSCAVIISFQTWT